MFNNFTEKQLETFNARISSIHSTAKSQGKGFLGQNFDDFFEHLKKVSKKKEKMNAVNPLTLDPKEFYS